MRNMNKTALLVIALVFGLALMAGTASAQTGTTTGTSTVATSTATSTATTTVATSTVATTTATSTATTTTGTGTTTATSTNQTGTTTSTTTNNTGNTGNTGSNSGTTSGTTTTNTGTGSTGSTNTGNTGNTGNVNTGGGSNTTATTSTTTNNNNGGGSITLRMIWDEIMGLKAQIAYLQMQIQMLMNRVGLNSDGSNATSTPTSNDQAGVSGPVTVTPNNWTVRAGTTVDFTGRNFGREEDVRVEYGGNPIRVSHADGGGNWSTGSITVSTQTGSHTYNFTGVRSGISGSVTITVIP